MRAKILGVLATLALAGLAGGAIAAAAGGNTAAASAHDATASRLDDGKQLAGQARISEQQAIAAAKTAASGPLNEVDLEHAGGRLVFNVDVGAHDVKVDADSGRALAVDTDD